MRRGSTITHLWVFFFLIQAFSCHKEAAEQTPQGVSPGESVSPGAITPTTETPARPPQGAAAKQNAPPVISKVAILPDPARATDTLKTDIVASDPNEEAVTLEYVWIKNGEHLSNKDASLTPGVFKKGDFVAVLVAPSDTKMKGESVMSPQVRIQNSPPRIISPPPEGGLGADLTYTYQVKAEDPDGDTLKYSLPTAPSGMTIDSSTGLITWKPDPQKISGTHEVEVLVEDGDGGRAAQKYTLTLSFQKPTP